MEMNWSIPSKNREEFATRVRFTTSPDLSNRDVIEIYNQHAEVYEQDVASFAVLHVYSILSDAIEDILGGSKSANILDAAAGTGLLGDHLNERGYFRLDALDASDGMLKIARRKNIYKNTICDYLGPSNLNIKNDTYDLVGIISAFEQGHVMHDCFPELIRITKKGGFITFLLREVTLCEVECFRENFESALCVLEEGGFWQQLKRQRYESSCYGGSAAIVFTYQIM